VTWVTPAALLIVLAISAGVEPAARPAEPPTASGRTSTRGQLLVATDSLRDPRFVQSVVYMLRHDATGALGLVVNRPVATVSLARILESLGRDHDGARGDIRVHYGGPVESGRGFVLHSGEWMVDESQVVQDGIAVTSDPKVFEALGRGAGPRRVLFAVGYAGWAPGQLETEIEAGFWIVVNADEALIFDNDADAKWERATQRRRLTL
jgi:putative transcriptional regulator